jgi:hypothetical protein
MPGLVVGRRRQAASAAGGGARRRTGPLCSTDPLATGPRAATRRHLPRPTKPAAIADTTAIATATSRVRASVARSTTGRDAAAGRSLRGRRRRRPTATRRLIPRQAVRRRWEHRRRGGARGPMPPRPPRRGGRPPPTGASGTGVPGPASPDATGQRVPSAGRAGTPIRKRSVRAGKPAFERCRDPPHLNADSGSAAIGRALRPGRRPGVTSRQLQPLVVPHEGHA